MPLRFVFIWLTIVSAVLIRQVKGHTLSDAQRLRKELLIDNGYDKTMRPVLNQSKALEVSVYMAVTGIYKLDIASGVLLSPGYSVASWRDEQLIWKSSDFGGLHRLSMSSAEIWIPEFVQFGATESEFTLTPAWVYENGTVVLLTAGLFEGTCQLDFLRYPFDEHVCDFTLQPDAYDSSEVQLTLLSNSSGLELFEKHGEWEISNSVSNILLIVEPLSKIQFHVLARSLTISRRHLFVVMHTAVPLFLTAILNVMIFVVPLRSGERITFSTAILLNLVFFTTNLSDDLPHNSLKISVCSVLMTTINVTTTLGVIVSVILCRLDRETVAPVPSGLKRLATHFIACRLQKCTKTPKVDPKRAPDGNNEERISYVEAGSPTHKRVEDDTSVTTVSWSLVAESFDIIMFDLNFTILMIICVVFWCLLLVK